MRSLTATVPTADCSSPEEMCSMLASLLAGATILIKRLSLSLCCTSAAGRGAGH